MPKLEVFDPAMCCSTGICGPSVNPALIRFAADLDWLSKQGVEVRRYNLSQEPAAFAGNSLVREKLASDSTTCLPLILLDGVEKSAATYPSRQQLAELTGVTPGVNSEAAPPVSTPINLTMAETSAGKCSSDCACNAPTNPAGGDQSAPSSPRPQGGGQ